METPTIDARTPLLGPINASAVDIDEPPQSSSSSLGFFAVVFLTVNATLGENCILFRITL